jgi:hypothetical protein
MLSLESPIKPLILPPLCRHNKYKGGTETLGAIGMKTTRNLLIVLNGNM